jgi:hypothetical protein
MQRLEVSCVVRPIYGSFGAKGLISHCLFSNKHIIIIIINERFIAQINIKTYMIVTKLFLNYNQFTTVS